MDRRLFRRFAARLKQTRILDDPDTTFLQAGGFGQWKRVKEVEWTLHKVLKLDVSIYSIFDRDYRSDGEVADFGTKVQSEGVSCRVLARKEVENYLLIPALIKRVLIAKAAERDRRIDGEEIESLLGELTETFEDDVRSQSSSNYVRFQKLGRRSEDESVLHREANRDFRRRWTTMENRLRVVPGKEFISVLSSVCQSRFSFSVTPSDLVQSIRVEEIDSDLKDILEEMERMPSR